MSPTATDATWLQGKQVCVTGRLASMTRAEATHLIETHGGAVSASVTQKTDYIIVGQDGGPLDRSGRLTAKLEQARKLHQAGQTIAILPEEELLARLGLEADAGVIHRLYSTTQLCKILRVAGERIRAWLKAGLIQPAEIRHGIAYFDYRQVSWAKTLSELADAGVKPDQIRKSLEQLKKWLPDASQPLDQLVLLEENGELLIRLENGQLAEPTGQPRFDFRDEPEADAHPHLSLTKGRDRDRSAEEWFTLGSDRETASRWVEAAEAYRQALLVGGPNAVVSFNLANVLYALGQKEMAAERFRQAIEIDPQSAGAWNNLGVVLSELGQVAEAVRSFEKVLELDPHFADVHYNLADALEQLGHTTEAKPHWQLYLRNEPAGPWADYARKRLARNG